MCKLKSLLIYIALTFLICYSHAQPKRRKSPNRPIIQEEETVPIPEVIQTQESAKEGISEQPPSFQNPEQQQQEVDLDPVDEEKMLMKEWEEYMSDFTPSDLITFDVKARTEETCYEDIQIVPSNIRGAWFVASNERQDIDFKILDNRNQLIQSRNKKREGIFYFTVNKPGIYKFVFSNNR